MYYQRTWAEHKWEQISEGRFYHRWPDQLYCMSQHSSSTANSNKYKYINVTYTFLGGALFERTLLFRWAWAVTEQNDRMERHAAQWWRLSERGNLNTAGWCGVVYIFGCRKFSASQVNGQNDSSRHIICLEDFLYSSYSSNSRNRFSPSVYVCARVCVCVCVYVCVFTRAQCPFKNVQSLSACFEMLLITFCVKAIVEQRDGGKSTEWLITELSVFITFLSEYQTVWWNVEWKNADIRTGSAGPVSRAPVSAPQAVPARLHASSFDHEALAHKTWPGLVPA